ncbi:MAG: acyl-CoA dehydrogenase family protein, partial [Bacteroidia bacterium]|nr:acyl-CoA dehydrogenase family protein [Bacteroidia bacterium]
MNKLSREVLPELSAEALSFIPLFYIAWSDTVLSPSEMAFIHRKLDSYAFLNQTDKEYLLKQTNPLTPPPTEVFHQWKSLLQRAAKQLPDKQKINLVELGVEMAYQGTGKQLKKDLDHPQVLEALVDIRSALGLNRESEQLVSVLLKDEKTMAESGRAAFDAEKLKSILDGRTEEVKDRMRQLLRDPVFSVSFIPDKETHRGLVLERLRKLARQGLSGYSFPVDYGGTERISDYLAVFEMLGYNDLSLAIKFGVQYGLFGGAIMQLGTEWHHRTFLPGMIKGDLLGCFAMTETSHGSNVKNLETTAHYNHADKTLTIHTPRLEAGKEYIGNALHAHYAVVFAQLIVNGTGHGVNAIVVQLRDKEGKLMPGIRVEDNGYKMGLNGVDNGRIWFDHVQVPVRNLLDKYAQIKDDGSFDSPIKNQSKRFFTMLGALVTGRIAVGLLGNNASKKALTNALRYAMRRRQFAPKDGMKETLIIDYPSHQKRLFPLLAKTYAYSCALDDLALEYVSEDERDHRRIETLAAGVKAKASWHTSRTFQECREACGGKGYLSENSLSSLKADTDIFTTFEGDNTVLMQLVAKGVLTNFKQSFHDDGYMA